MSALPREAVREDHRLEKASETTAEELMRHRWHWTLDETNEKRVSFNDYARSVGLAAPTIRKYAHGYALLTESETSGPLGRLSPSQARERATLGAETEAVVEAVAEARGLEFGTVRKGRPTEVRRVREVARELAEKHGTTVEEEAPKVAEWVVKAEKTNARETAKRKEKVGLRYIEMEGHLEYVRRRLLNALNLAHSIEWGEEELELLSHTLENVKALLGLIDVALSGAADVDWDQELARLTGGAA